MIRSHYLEPQIVQLNRLKPPLKWAGGKRWLVPKLQSLWQQNPQQRLVEPFSGGLAVSLGLMPQTALLNDINPHLINFYHWLQRGLVFEIELRYERSLFLEHRTRFNDLVHKKLEQTKEAAELFFYLNRTGFNGLCRFNRSGEFNVPFGKYTNITYPKNLLEYRYYLASWVFTVDDFSAMNIEPNDLIYADPPYDVEFTSYNAGGFSWNDQLRLAIWLKAHPGTVIASNQATPRIIELYSDLGFQITIVDAPRRISCDGNRATAREILAMKTILD